MEHTKHYVPFVMGFRHILDVLNMYTCHSLPNNQHRQLVNNQENHNVALAHQAPPFKFNIYSNCSLFAWHVFELMETLHNDEDLSTK